MGVGEALGGWMAGEGQETQGKYGSSRDAPPSGKEAGPFWR